MKKEKIMEVAKALFLKEGFSNVSVDEITKSAGISKGGFYVYFKSKDELLEEIVRSSVNALIKEIGQVAMDKNDPVFTLEVFFRKNIELSGMYISGILIGLRDVNFLELKDDSLSNFIENEVRGAICSFIKLLKVGQCSNEDLLLLWGVTLSLWIEVGFKNGKPDVRKIAEKVWHGIGGDVDA
jgi:AcrR family transcriptional regulator